MNMENFITGYPGREYQIRETLAKTIGEEKATFYFDKVSTKLQIYISVLPLPNRSGALVPRVLLHRIRRQILQGARPQLHPYCLQLPPL